MNNNIKKIIFILSILITTFTTFTIFVPTSFGCGTQMCWRESGGDCIQDVIALGLGFGTTCVAQPRCCWAVSMCDPGECIFDGWSVWWTNANEGDTCQAFWEFSCSATNSGKWDPEDNACVGCDSNDIETMRDYCGSSDGGGGDCEEACGADSACDEHPPGYDCGFGDWEYLNDGCQRRREIKKCTSSCSCALSGEYTTPENINEGEWCGSTWESCYSSYSCDVRTYQSKCSLGSCAGTYQKSTGCSTCTACDDDACGDWIDFCYDTPTCDTRQHKKYCQGESCSGEWHGTIQNMGTGACAGESCGENCNPACTEQCCTKTCSSTELDCQECTPPDCICDCDSWTPQACGYSTCPWYQQGQTRTCIPDDCKPEFQCVCSEACCTSWTDQGCGQGGCPVTMMYQTRDCGTCSYSESQCVLDPNCGVSAPTVTNSTGASNVTSNSARLNGEVTSTGGEDPTVHIYWGDNDGGTNPASWDYDENLGAKGLEIFFYDAGGLNPETTYYYRSYASNSAGNDWADSTESLTTETFGPCPLNKSNEDVLITQDCYIEGEMWLKSGNLSITGATVQILANSSYTFEEGYELNMGGGAYILKSEAETKIDKSATSGHGLTRRPITIDNTQNSSALVDYPVLLTVDTTFLTVFGKMRSDCGDVRFVDSDGITQLNYWLESGCNSANTKIWIKVPTIPANSTKTIYMEYGSGEISMSNALLTNIGQFREHKTWVDPWNPSILFDQLNFGGESIRIDSFPRSSTGYGYVFFVVPKGWLNGKYLRWRWGGYTDWSTGSIYAWYVRIYDGSYLRSSSSDFPNGASIPTKGAGQLQYWQIAKGNGFWGVFEDVIQDVSINIDSAQEDLVTIFLQIEDPLNTAEIFGLWYWLEVNTGPGGSGNIATVVFQDDVLYEQSSSLGDYGLYRKSTSPEPTTSVGPEE